MRKIIKYVLILPLFLGGCSKSNEHENIALDNKIEVNIKSNSTQTRTAISDDLMSTEWVEGDQIALWAQGAQSSDWALEAESFTLKYFGSDYSEANFSASISPMSEGDYTYYSVYPTPVSTNGTQASFTLSAEQSGEYDGVNDIMVAEAMVSSELTTSTIGMPSLSFKHLMHMIRIEIPDGRNYYGKEISKLEITFPQSVVGDIVVDATTPDATPTLNNGTSKITVNFAEPFEAGEGEYIWLFVNPTILDGEIKFIGYNDDGSCSAPIRTTVSGLELKASNITKMTLSLLEPEITTLNVTISSSDMLSKIGESLQTVTFTAPSGVVFSNGESTFEMDAQSNSDIYSVSFYNASEFTTQLLSGSLGVELETKSVIKTASDISLSSVTIAEENALTATVPYFFYTTFSEISTGGKGPESMDLLSESDDVAIEGMDGWYGSQRSIWYAGSYIAIRPFTYIYTDYESRINSCTLSNWGLKADTNVSITISYTAYWTKNKFSTMKIKTGTSYYTYLEQSFINSVTTTFASSGTNTSISVDITDVYSDQHISWESDGSNDSFNMGTSSYDIISIDELYVKIK